jgi:hypothetical protein
MRLSHRLALTLLIAGSAPLHAQDGAFDMGSLGMNGAIDQATRQARGQAGEVMPPSPKGAARWNFKMRSGRRHATDRPRRNQATCANARRQIGQAGTDPRLPQLVSLCDRAGY